MTKRKLKKKLRKMAKLRDAWCQEYTRLRDMVDEVSTTIDSWRTA